MKLLHTLTYTCLVTLMIVSCKPTPKETDTGTTSSTDPGFSFEVVADNSMPGLPAIQSFVFAMDHKGHWLFFGGRKNGFHGIEAPDANFPYRLANKHIYVYDTKNKTVDSMSVDDLPDDLVYPFSSSNMQSDQEGDLLYVTGGYGKGPNDTKDSIMTHDVLSVVNVPQMIQAVKNQDKAALADAIVYTHDTLFRVTGGEMHIMDDGYLYLVFGQDFNGLYTDFLQYDSLKNIIQRYTNQVRKFKISIRDKKISLDTVIIYEDEGSDYFTSEYRRRDLNVVKGITPEGKMGLTAYSGVFRCPCGPPQCICLVCAECDTCATGCTEACRKFPRNPPWLNPIYIEPQANSGTTITIDNSFEQSKNVYDCWHILIYDPNANKMYTNLFGGIGDTAHYEPVICTTNPNVKFINTLTRDLNTGQSTEHIHSNLLPEYLGSDGEFIPIPRPSLMYKNSSIYDLQKMAGKDTVLLGHLFGGILAEGPTTGVKYSYHGKDTVFTTSATNQLYKVYLKTGTQP